jgi:large subunit ribosomal protein L5
MTALKLTSNDYKTKAIEALVESFPGLNRFALPVLDKISINVGVGKFESKEKDDIANYLEKLTGQKPKEVKSKKSIAGFKLRKGDTIGYVVTLRGRKIYDFLLHLIYIALPRSRDFKGISQAAFDKNYSTYSLGIETASIFPVIGFDSSVNFGMQINIVFKTGSKNNLTFLQNLNFPFKK